MGAREYKAGDRVELTITYAPGVAPKRHGGRVLAIGRRGVHVALDGGEERWLHTNKLTLVMPAETPRTPVANVDPLMQLAEPGVGLAMAAGRGDSPHDRGLVPANLASEPAATLDQLAAQGVDLVALYLALGRGIMPRVEARAEAAARALAEKTEALQAAEALLAEARRDLRFATHENESARHDLAALKRQAGGES